MSVQQHISRYYHHLHRTLTRTWSRTINYVIDTTNWSFFWDAHYITTSLKKSLGLCTRVIYDPWRLKGQIIHFGDRYLYLNGPFQSLHPSNYVFLTWFHGEVMDPNPQMQRLFTILPQVTTYIQKIVVPCQLSRRVLEDLGIPEAKIVTIPLGVDLERFVPATEESRSQLRARLGIPKESICIGYFQKDGVGWGKGDEPKLVKGPDLFLQVVENLSTHFDKVMIVLTGPARGYVKKGLEKLRVPYLHHYLSRYLDIVSYYQVLDLYLITSRAEGGPKALLESWATGIPVVATRVGMAADLVRHGENGMLAELEDVEALTRYASALIEDAALRERYRRRALEDVTHYGWDAIAQQYYHALYHQCLT